MAQKVTLMASTALITLICYTVAGFQDDYIKIKGKGNDGLTPRENYSDKLQLHYYLHLHCY